MRAAAGGQDPQPGKVMTTDEQPASVFALKASYRDPVRQSLFRMMRRSIERLFLLDQLDLMYRAAAQGRPEEDFLTSTLRVFDIRTEASAEDLARIPATGPAVVVANHPFGGIEGVALLSLIRRVRPDVKIMANYLLGRMPEMHPYCIFVDPFGGQASPKANIRPVKESIRWLRDGHLLAVFPSGEVSHLRLNEGQVSDPKWSETVAGIVRIARAPALPVFVEGRNSAFFQLMGLVHPRLRTAMLPREMLNKRGTTLRFRIGSPVPYARVEKMEDTEMMDYLRLRTYILMSRSDGAAGPAQPRRFGVRRPKEQLPIAEPLYPELLAEDIAMLPPETLMIETDEFAVHFVTTSQIPHLLHEIGRLREVTFRSIGEGTGRAVDLDRFDQHYCHLILWSRKKRELAGAYRIGRSDEILARQGKRGLYTSTLFRYTRSLIEEAGPALELGRSFIRPEYQRSYSGLLLLWKGIARVIVREPRYRILFGPVSINNEYNSTSRQMLESFLRANNFNSDYARLVKPRNRPMKPLKHRWNPDIFRRTITDPDDMSEVIGEIERDHKGVPVLLKQYLKLGGKLLGFNVDPEFSDVLDGLIWVDLRLSDPRILGRFLGREDCEAYLRFHGRMT